MKPLRAPAAADFTQPLNRLSRSGSYFFTRSLFRSSQRRIRSVIGKCPLHLQSSAPVTTRLSSEPTSCPLVIARSSRPPRTNAPPGSMELARKEASPRHRGRRLPRDRGRRSSFGLWFLLIASQVGVSSHRSYDLAVNSKGRENQY